MVFKPDGKMVQVDFYTKTLTAEDTSKKAYSWEMDIGYISHSY